MDWLRPAKRPRLTDASNKKSPTDHTSTVCNNDELWGDDDITAEEFDFLQSQVESQIGSRILSEQKLRENLCPVGLLGSTPTSGGDGDHLSQAGAQDKISKQDVSNIQTQLEKCQHQLKAMQEQQDVLEGKLKMVRAELFQKTADLDQERLQKQKLVEELAQEQKQQVKEMNKSIKSLQTELQFKEQEVMSAKERILLLEQQLTQKNQARDVGDQLRSPHFPNRPKVVNKREVNGLPSFSRHDLDEFKSIVWVNQSVQTEKDGLKSNMVPLAIQNREGFLLNSAISSIMIDLCGMESLDDMESDHNQHFLCHSQIGSSRSPVYRPCQLCTTFEAKVKSSNNFKLLCSGVSRVLLCRGFQVLKHDCKKQRTLCGAELKLLPHISNCLLEYWELVNTISSRSGEAVACDENCAVLSHARNACVVAICLVNKLFQHSNCVKWSLLNENDHTGTQTVLFTDMNEGSEMNLESQNLGFSCKVLIHVLNTLRVCSLMETTTESRVLEEALNFLYGISACSVKGLPDTLEGIHFGVLVSGKYGLRVARLTTDVLCLLTSHAVFPALMNKCSDAYKSILQGISCALTFNWSSEEKELSSEILTLNVEFLTSAVSMYDPLELHNCSSCWPELIQSVIHALYGEMQANFSSPSSVSLACLHKGVMLLSHLSTKMSSVFKGHRAKAEESYVCLICGLTQLSRTHNLKSALELIQDLWDFGMDDAGEFEVEDNEPMDELEAD